MLDIIKIFQLCHVHQTCYIAKRNYYLINRSNWLLRIIEIFTLAQNCRSEHATASLSWKLNYLPIEFRHSLYTIVSSILATFQFINSIQPRNFTHFVWRVQMTWLWPQQSASDKTCNCKVKVNKQLLMLHISYLFLHSHVQQPCYIATNI